MSQSLALFSFGFSGNSSISQYLKQSLVEGAWSVWKYVIEYGLFIIVSCSIDWIVCFSGHVIAVIQSILCWIYYIWFINCRNIISEIDGDSFNNKIDLHLGGKCGWVVFELFPSLFVKCPKPFPLIRHAEKCVFALIVMLANHQSFTVLRLQISYVGNVILFSSGLVQNQQCNWCGQWWSLNKIFSVHYLFLLPVSSACLWLVEYMTL